MLRNRTLALYPLGYPLHLEVTGETAPVHQLSQAARANWGAPEHCFRGRPMQIRAHVEPGTSAGRLASPRLMAHPSFTVRPWGFEMAWSRHTRGRFESSRLTGGMQMHWFAGRNASAFRQQPLETLVLTALDEIYFTPLHAACVARNGRAVLLCGDSGAGKSCLTYACARKGWTLVADDAVHLAPGPENTVAGGLRTIRLREAARALFPELEGRPCVTASNGKRAIHVEPERGQFRVAKVAIPAKIVFLSRRAGPPRVSCFEKDTAVAYFAKYLWQWNKARHLGRLGELLRIGAHQLEYEHVDHAVEMLEEMVVR